MFAPRQPNVSSPVPKFLRDISAPCPSQIPITHAYCQVASISELGRSLNGFINLIPCMEHFSLVFPLLNADGLDFTGSLR